MDCFAKCVGRSTSRLGSLSSNCVETGWLHVARAFVRLEGRRLSLLQPPAAGVGMNTHSMARLSARTGNNNNNNNNNNNTGVSQFCHFFPPHGSRWRTFSCHILHHSTYCSNAFVSPCHAVRTPIFLCSSTPARSQLSSEAAFFRQEGLALARITKRLSGPGACW